VVDAGSQAELKVLFNDVAGDVAHVLVAHAAIVRELRNRRITVLREAQWPAVAIEEVFLFETNPQVRVVLDGGAVVRGVGCTVGMHDFAEDEVYSNLYFVIVTRISSQLRASEVMGYKVQTTGMDIKNP
jgi:hypothetical protein